MNKSLGVKDFAERFSVDEKEISNFCGELIESMDFKYRVCSKQIREKIFLDVIKKCGGELSISGPHRKGDWQRGWRELLQEFNNSGGDLKMLVPKEWHRYSTLPLRYKGDYIISNSDLFHYDFALVFRHWLYKKYFSDYENIYEFGCGTGQNLVVMAEIFPEKRFFGLDWVSESQELLNTIRERYGWKIEGIKFDFFNPDYEVEILPKSLVYTSCALEQVGNAYDKFLDYLLAKKPSLCINMEPLAEYYDENKLFDYVALMYHRKRKYLDGYLTRLQKLEEAKRIKVIFNKRIGFGSLYHEGFMYVIWKIL